MYADCHLHTRFSGDSDTPPTEQIEKAISLGMKRICITDHDDHDVVSDIDFNLDFPVYFKELSELREKYKDRIEISIGVEMGLQSHISGYLEELSEKYPFDYIIGSVHFVDGLDPYYDEYFDTHRDNAYERFFEVTHNRIKKISCFDSLGHLDYIVRYGQKHGLSYSYGEFADYIDPILKVLIEKGKALECNTGALARGMTEPNPCREIFRRYKELGGELITLGSDAHSPESVGIAFASAGEMLLDCGFKYYAVYRERKAELLKL
ncbi:MAG: histidinol-phosphatase HisJ family protein [Oscillospiraceae bacterium]|nr:histidinol-phosphatase HisJ family protein [Oscillospiraceae bacterium]